MIDYKNAMTIQRINRYSELFSRDEATAKAELRQMLNYWHPDRNDRHDAELIFGRINDIYNSKVAMKSVAYDNTKSFEYNYVNTLGYVTIYYNVGQVLFVFDDDYGLCESFYRNFNTNVKSTRPDLIDKYRFYTKDLSIIFKSSRELLIKIHEDFLPMTLIEKYIDKEKDYKTSFWIVSRAYDLNLYFNSIGLHSNGCVMEMCFVDVKNHIMIDLSSLFFSTKDKLNFLDPWQIQYYPMDNISKKKSDFKSTLNLVKAFGLRLFGDKNSTGNKHMVSNSHPCVIDYLGSPGSDNLLKSYQTWQKEISIKAFGAQEFHDIKLSYEQLLEY